jgi:hypothetical protein
MSDKGDQKEKNRPGAISPEQWFVIVIVWFAALCASFVLMIGGGWANPGNLPLILVVICVLIAASLPIFVIYKLVSAVFKTNKKQP